MDKIQQQIYTNLAHEGLKPGHHTRDRTVDIDGAMQARFEEICNRWGVYEPGTEFRRALVQIPLWDEAPPPAPPSHFLVILTTNKGRDGQGRLGAVLRHIVRIPAAQYRGLEYHPFRLLEQGQLLEHWLPGTPLPDIVPEPRATSIAELQLIFPERYQLLRVLLAQLLETGAVRIPVDADSMAMEEIFAQVVTLTPLAWRPQLSLATFAFRNPEDYGLVAFHQRDMKVRRSLEILEEGVMPTTGAAVGRYLGELFTAMESQDWQTAVTLIRGTVLPDAITPHPDAVQATTTPTRPDATTTTTAAALPSPDDAGPGSTATAAPRRRKTTAEPAHHPHWQQGGAAGGNGRRKIPIWLPIIIVAVILGVVGWILATRGGDDAGANGHSDAVSQLVSLRADGLTPLLDRHEQLLGQLLADGTRDLDLREAMLAAAPTLAARVGQAVTADSRRLDRQLSPTGEVVSRNLADLGAELQGVVDLMAGNRVRVSALERLLTNADLAALTAAYVDSTHRVLLDRLPPGNPTPLDEALEQRAAALAEAAAALQTMGTEARYTDTAWSPIAAALDQSMQRLPPDLGASPRLVRAAGAAATAYVDLRVAEENAGLKAAATAIPYDSAALQRGAVAEAARTLTARTVDLTAAGAAVPPPVARVVGFHELGSQSRLKAPANLSDTAARELLGELATVCDPPPSLPCDDPRHAAHITRWQLEAWRALDGPQSPAGRPVLTALGPASVPSDDPGAVATMVDLVDQMTRAPKPAPGSLVTAVSAQARQTSVDLFRAICTDWLALNQDRATDQREAFGTLYQQLQARLARLRQADDTDGPSAFADLQATAREITALDLTAIARTTSLQGAARAARQLQNELSRRHFVGVARLDLELLRNQDYAGTRHPAAHPTIRISTVTGTTQSALYEYAAPTMPAATGAGFEPATLQVHTSVPFRAADTLLLTATEPGGSLWFHLYIEPPRRGHVAAALAGLHRVEVTPEAMRAAVARPNALPPRVDRGDVVATLRVVLEPGFWAELGGEFPDLP